MIGTAAAIAMGAATVGGATVSAISNTSASNAQLQASREQVAAQQAQRKEAIGFAQQYAGPTADEITQMHQMVTNQQTMLNQTMSSLEKQRTLLDAADPAVNAAGQNLVELLQGKSSAMLAPLQQQLDRQRNQLKQDLASKYGSGWESTTNGMDAMMKFDMQSSGQIAQAQNTAISTAAGAYGITTSNQNTVQGGITNTMSSMFNNIGNANANLLSGMNTIQSRQAGSFISAANGNQVDYGAPVSHAGAPYVGASALGGTLGNLGSMGLGANVNSALNKQSFKDLGELFKNNNGGMSSDNFNYDFGGK